jgi:predicted ATP-grasp superfamily ATP-dependent carboligase
VIASLAARRTTQYPGDFCRTSCLVETIESTEVEEAAARLLEAIRYSGTAEVEFKYDSRDRTYKVLGVNSRAYGLGTARHPSGRRLPLLAMALVT